jgi:hypothetical protein
MKVCTRCGLCKPLDEFYDHEKGKYGKRSICKSCVCSRVRAWARRTGYMSRWYAQTSSEDRRGQAWSLTEDDFLVGHYGRGMTSVQCARELGRTVQAVLGRIAMLGLAARTGDWRDEDDFDFDSVRRAA